MLNYINYRHSFLLISLLYWSLMIWNFGLPGPYMDEFLDFSYLPAIYDADKIKLYHYRVPDNPFFPNLPILGGKIYAQIIIPYLGIPFFKLAGLSIASLRIFLALGGYFITIFIFFFSKKHFQGLYPLLLILFFILNPNFSFFLRSTYYIFYFSIFLSILSIYYFSKYLENEKKLSLILSGIFLTLSFNNFFIFFSTSLTIAFLYFYKLNFNYKKILFLFFGFLIAFLPIIYSLVSVKLIWPHFITSENNWGIPSYASNKIEVFSFENLVRIKNFIYDLSCNFSILTKMTGNFSVIEQDIRLFIFIFIIFFSQITFIMMFVKKIKFDDFQIFISCSVFIFLFLSFILQGINQSHYFLLEFLLYFQLFYFFYKNKKFKKYFILILVFFTLSNISVLFKAHSKLKKTEGVNLFNKQIENSVTFQKGILKHHHPIFYSWGFLTSFVFLSNGEINYSVERDIAKIQELQRKFSKISIYVVENEYQMLLKQINDANMNISRTIKVDQYDNSTIYRVILLDDQK